jgi:hypothetical protein
MFKRLGAEAKGLKIGSIDNKKAHIAVSLILIGGPNWN